MFDPSQFMSTLRENKVNGFDVMIMQSTENIQLVMDFYKRYRMNIPLEIALAELHLTRNDFIPSDYRKLQHWAEN